MADTGNLNFDFTDPQTLTRMLGIAIPILVGVVSKKVASQGLKATLNALLSAIGGSLIYLFAADGALNAAGFVNAVINTFLVSIATYYGVWKPTGLAGTVAEKTANFGIGPSPVLETEDKGAENPPEAAGDPIPVVEPEPQLLVPPLPPVKKAAARKKPAKKAVPPLP